MQIQFHTERNCIIRKGAACAGQPQYGFAGFGENLNLPALAVELDDAW